MKDNITFLNRFTDLFNLLNLIYNNKLRTSSPVHWDDKSEQELIRLFLNKNNNNFNLESNIRMLCFTYDSKTALHWNTYAKHHLSCCIEFDYKLIAKCFDDSFYNHRKVDYVKKGMAVLDSIDDINNLPFIKRLSYYNEKEYRIYKIVDTTTNDDLDLTVPIESIRRITISPYMSTENYNTLKNILLSINSELKIYKSTLLDNGKVLNKEKLEKLKTFDIKK